jgi:hypothetical protein
MTDDFDWEVLDRVVALLRGAHIRPMISIYGSPRWAGADTPGIHCPCDRAADPEWRRCGSRSRFATRMRCSTTGTSPTTPRTAASASPGLIFHRLWSPFSKHEGIFSWDAGLSALARNGAPTRLYRRIGTLHPGFHPPAFKPHPGGDIIVTTPPPPALSGPPKSPTPCTG